MLTQPQIDNIKLHNCIFIHVPKTGGTSIKQALGYNSIIGHKTAMLVRQGVGEEYWNNTFKFSIVRNPWDRTVSWYEYFKGWVDNIAFREWLLGKDMSNHWNSDWHHPDQPNDPFLQLNFMCDLDDNIIIDFIGKYENLNEDVEFAFNKINFPIRPLNHVNKTIRKPYQEYYDEETKQFIAEKCKKDIELFGYEF
jgi:hypothetical protein